MAALARSAAHSEAPEDCALCPRLHVFRSANRLAHPDWFNAPVPSFGDPEGRLLVVGLAPGLQGANRTGRPFTGDYAGDLLYTTLLKFGFARGTYGARPDDGLVLVDAAITNAVRCVPPENKPTPAEIRTCRSFHESRLADARRLRVIVCLGRIAHESTISALGRTPRSAPFAHGARHDISTRLALFDSYHCSRYNTNTGRLTVAMFESVFGAARDALEKAC